MSTGHEAGVTSSAVSPDGSFFVSASQDTTLKLWDPKTGEEIRTLAGHTQEVLRCAVGPDGRIYSAGPAGMFDSVFKGWDPESGDEVVEWTAQTGQPIGGLAVSPTGTFVTAIGEMGMVDIRDPVSGESLSQVEVGVASSGGSCLVTADGARIVAAGGRELRVVDPIKGKLGPSFRSPDYGGQPFALTPDACWIVFKEKDTGAVIGDLSSGRTRLLVEDEWFSFCSVSPDGSLVAECCNEVSQSWNSISGSSRTVEAASLLLRRIDSGELVHDLEFGKNEVLFCAFSPDGSLLFAVTPDALKILDVESGEEIGGIPLEAEPTCLVPHPSEPVVAVGDAVGGFHVLDLGVELGRIVVTAEGRKDELSIRCPACGNTSAVEQSQRGQDMACPSCGVEWRVNPFVLKMRSGPLRSEGPTMVQEEEQARQDEQRRLYQARNRALFTAGSHEDLAALAKDLDMPTTGAGSGGIDSLRAMAEGGPAPAPPKPRSFKEQVEELIIDELMELGIDPQQFSGNEAGQLVAATVQSSLLDLVGETAHLLTQDQKSEIMRVVAEAGDPLETVRFLHDTLPEFDVLEAFRAKLKAAFSRDLGKLGKVSGVATSAPAHEPSAAPGQLTPLNEQIKGIIFEELADADIGDLPEDRRQLLMAAATNASVQAMVSTLGNRVDQSVNAEFQRIWLEGNPLEVIRFFHETLPEADVLGEFRAGLKTALLQEAEKLRGVSDETLDLARRWAAGEEISEEEALAAAGASGGTPDTQAQQQASATGLMNQITAAVLEEASAVGVGLTDFEDLPRQRAMAMALSAAMSFLADTAKQFLDGGQQEQLQQLIQEGNPERIVGMIMEAMPGEDVMKALRTALKHYWPQVAEASGKQIRSTGHSPAPSSQKEVRMAAPLGEQIFSSLREELGVVGIDLNQFAEEIRPKLVAAALYPAVLAVVDAAKPFLNETQRGELQKRVDEGNPEKIMGFMIDSLPDQDLMATLRLALKEIAPQVADFVKTQLGQTVTSGQGPLLPFAASEPAKERRGLFRRRRK